MTNKKKRKAKSISAKTGMTHAAAINQLNKTEPPKPIEHTRWRPTKPETVYDMDLELQEVFGPPGHLEGITEIMGETPEAQEAQMASGLGWWIKERQLRDRLDPEHPINKVHSFHHREVPSNKEGHTEVFVSKTQEWGKKAPWKPGRLKLQPAAPRLIRLCGLNPETYQGFNWIPLDQLKEEDFKMFTSRPRSKIEVDEKEGTFMSVVVQVVDRVIKACQQTENGGFKGLPVWLQLAETIHRALENPKGVPLVFSDRESNSEGELRYLIQVTEAVHLDHFKQRFETPPIELQKVATTGRVEKYQRRVFDVATEIIHVSDGRVEGGSESKVSNFLDPANQ